MLHSETKVQKGKIINIIHTLIKCYKIKRIPRSLLLLDRIQKHRWPRRSGLQNPALILPGLLRPNLHFGDYPNWPPETNFIKILRYAITDLPGHQQGFLQPDQCN